MNSSPLVADEKQIHIGTQGSKPKPSTKSWSLIEANKTAARRILLVEDDGAIASFLSAELQSQGFNVEHVRDGEEAHYRLMEERGYDLLILELNLPKLDGVSLIERIRPVHYRLPVLVVTSRDRVEDKVTAFHSGADDFLTKPFSLMELLARVHALLRRNDRRIPDSTTIGDLTLYREQHRVERNGRRIELTPREFALLDVMMQNAGHPVARATLLEQVWNTPTGPLTNVVDVYMKYVRDKVDLPGEPRLIHTVRGFGYEIRE